jgi:hypothetical protein
VVGDETRTVVNPRGLSTPVATLGGVPLALRDHLCVFHRGRDERNRQLVPFLEEGLDSGRACTCTFFAAAGEKEHSLRGWRRTVQPGRTTSNYWKWMSPSAVICGTARSRPTRS